MPLRRAMRGYRFRCWGYLVLILILISMPHNAKPPNPEGTGGIWGYKSLTMTYFHTGTRTIIGAKSFHCPVRDGKEWYQLAMVIRHNLVLSCSLNSEANS